MLTDHIDFLHSTPTMERAASPAYTVGQPILFIPYRLPKVPEGVEAISADVWRAVMEHQHNVDRLL